MPYLTLPGSAFRPSRSHTEYQQVSVTVTGGRTYRGITPVNQPDVFTARVAVPNNVNLHSVISRVCPVAGGTIRSWTLLGLRQHLNTYDQTTVSGVSTPTIRSTTFPTMYARRGYTNHAAFHLDPGDVLVDLRATYDGPEGEFHTDPRLFQTGPVRAYDSRTQHGQLIPGEDRLIFLSDLNVERISHAVVLNVTVTNTGNAGWLAVRPNGTPVTGTSTVNWYRAGQTVANATTVALIPPGPGYANEIRVWCGGSPTDVIIDILGYYAA